MAIPPVSAAARPARSSSISARSRGPCSTASISTSKSPPCPSRNYAATPPPSPAAEIRAPVEPSRAIRRICALDDAGERTLEMAVRRMGLSARAHDRILKVARTIADLGGAETVAAKHVAEAVQYRSLDRNYWN